MPGLRIYRRHLRTIPGYSARPGYCARGSRAWFARHGLDWSKFLREGIAAEEMLATGDGLAIALVEWARKCEQEEQRGQQ